MAQQPQRKRKTGTKVRRADGAEFIINPDGSMTKVGGEAATGTATDRAKAQNVGGLAQRGRIAQGKKVARKAGGPSAVAGTPESKASMRATVSRNVKKGKTQRMKTMNAKVARNIARKKKQ